MDSTHIYHYTLNSSEFLKIGKFGIIFDAIPREIDDLAVSSRQMAPLPGNLRHIFEIIRQF